MSDNYLQQGFRKTMLSKGTDPHQILIDEIGPAFAEYRRAWEESSVGGLERSFPIHLDIELNPSCNLRCPMCVISAEENPKASKKYWMCFDHYKKLIDEGVANGLMSLQLNNINEPLIRRDIPEFVAYARKAGVLDVMMSTNGTLLTEELSEQLIKAGLTKLSFSIDAITPETYDKIRVGGKYDKVLKNLFDFLAVRKRLDYRTPLLKVTFVKSPLNAHELDEFVKFWEEKADLIAIQNINNPFDGELWEKTKEYFSMQPKVVEKTDKICPHPFQRMTIQADGMALLCCNLRGPELPLGNVIEKGLAAVYQGETAKEYRKLHREGRYKEIETCRKCLQFSTLANPEVKS